jgi:hypothetical protein
MANFLRFKHGRIINLDLVNNIYPLTSENSLFNCKIKFGEHEVWLEETVDEVWEAIKFASELFYEGGALNSHVEVGGDLDHPTRRIR